MHRWTTGGACRSSGTIVRGALVPAPSGHPGPTSTTRDFPGSWRRPSTGLASLDDAQRDYFAEPSSLRPSERILHPAPGHPPRPSVRWACGGRHGPLRHASCDPGVSVGCDGGGRFAPHVFRPSVVSLVECRIEPGQLDSRVGGRELPIDAGVLVVSGCLPCLDLATDQVDVVDSSVQTLLSEHVQLDFGHVQPTPVLRGVHELEPVPQCLGLVWSKRLVK